MSDRLFYSRVQSVVGAETDRFSDLVRVSGLDPASDFRRADLSYTDLRGEDLRDFDFSFASFHGAFVAGALFNKTVKKRQLQSAEKTSRAVVAIIGNRLPQFESRATSMLGKDIVVPKQFADSAHKVAGDQDRRRIVTGIHLGDSTDLARRRMAHPFNLHDRTISNSRSAVIVFTPVDDIDFDALIATQKRFARTGKTAMIFLVPELMLDTGSRQTILRHRLNQISSDLILDFSIGSGFTAGPDINWSARGAIIGARAVNFLKVVARAKRVTSQPILTGIASRAPLAPWVFDGRRGKRQAFYTAIADDLQEMEDEVNVGPVSGGRRHIFIRQDRFEPAPANNLLKTLTPLYGSCALSVFEAQKDSDPDYWIATGPPETPLWGFLIDSQPFA